MTQVPESGVDAGDHVNLAKWVVGGRRRSYWEYQDDLSAAYHCLVRCARTYRPGYGTFSNYAVPSMRKDVVRNRVVAARFRRKAVVVEDKSGKKVVAGSVPVILFSEFGGDFVRGRRHDFAKVEDHVPSLIDRLTAESAAADLLRRLTIRERLVVRMRYGFDGPPLTLDEVGRTLGITKERVRQIEVRAVRGLRRAVAENDFPP